MLSVTSSIPTNGLATFGLAIVTTLALALPARAGTVTLWACHGPEGQPLGSAPLTTAQSGDGLVTTYSGGCDDPGTSVSDGGLLATFQPSVVDPRVGSSAGWDVAVPNGTTLTAIGLQRATIAVDDSTLSDDPLAYTASVNGSVVESASLVEATPLTGSTTLAASGQAVHVGVMCGPEPPPPQTTCVEPSSGAVGLELSALTLSVNDSAPPAAAVSGISDPASGALGLRVTATDPGLGLASATVTLDGHTVATASFGGTSCAPLPSNGPGLNLTLSQDCPASVTSVALPVSTDSVPDGPHRLAVTVADIAGNTTTAVDQTIDVLNHPTIGSSFALVSLGSGGTPVPVGGVGGSTSGVGGSSTGGAGSSKACRSPRLSAALIGRPMRISHHGVAVLWQGTRYLFQGRLTCVRNGRRVGAPDNSVVDIDSLIATRVTARVRSGRRTRTRTHIRLRTVDRTGAATYRHGLFRVLLHPHSTRTIEFRYGAPSSHTLVRILVIVTPHVYVRVTPNRNVKGLLTPNR